MKRWDDTTDNNKSFNATNLGLESFHNHLRDFSTNYPEFNVLLNKNNILGGSSLKFKQFILANEENSIIQKYLVDVIQKLSIWVDSKFYLEVPLIYPYSVRERTTSQDRRRGVEDNWGASNELGFIIDDNSMIKDFIRNYPIKNNFYYGIDKPKKGFIACHLWENTTTNHKLFSFIPNICWLPTPIARLSDEHSSLFSKLLKIISSSYYRKIEPKSPKMSSIVNNNWNLLKLDDKENVIPFKLNFNYNELCFSIQPIERKIKLIKDIKKILAFIDKYSKNSSKEIFDNTKLLHKRYKSTLSDLLKSNPESINYFKNWMIEYLDALEDNFSYQNQSELFV